jgi:SecD/SecF fusion protein
MSDPNRLLKWIFVIGLVVISLLILYPPSEKLKGGIDLVGGTSLLFEIDTTDLDRNQQQDLSTRVMDILKERVDPKGQLNIEWRPVGNTRLEVRMPRPPKEALERRRKYNRAEERLVEKIIKRFDVELALDTSGDERSAQLEALQRNIIEREPLIKVLTVAYDKRVTAQKEGDVVAKEAASEEYESAMADLLATNLPISRFTDILALPADQKKRREELTKLRADYPSYDAGNEGDAEGKLLTKAVAAYDTWAASKADLEDPSDLKRRLRGAGVLEFRILADRDPSSPGNTRDPNPQLSQPIAKYTEQLARYGPRPKAGDRYRWFPVDDVVSFMYLRDLSTYESQKTDPEQPIVEEYAGRYYALVHNDPAYGLLQGRGKKTWSLRRAFPDTDPLSGRNIVSFQLDPRGGQLFGELTGNNIGRSLCIMLDGTAMSHAVIQSRINERGQITGSFTVEKVQNLVRTFEAGSLPARLKETPLRENTIGPSLGETNRSKGLKAAAWGAIAVVVFMLIYYGPAAGGMADIALAMNLLFVLSIMAFIQATFTLPGIAGLILVVGMAVDANVLIFERIREERDRGVIFKKALNAGYDKAFSTIMDANITTLITCVILGFVGSEEIKGFAMVLGIGISTSMFTSLFVTRLIFNSLIAWGVLKEFSMRRIIGQPSVDWLALRRFFWPISTVAVIAGLGAFITLSVVRTEATYDIEFLGGTSLQLDLKPGVAMTDEEMTRAVTADQAGADSAVGWLNQAATDLEAASVADGEAAGQFVLTSPTLTGDQLRVLMHQTMEDDILRGGTRAAGHSVVFDGKPGVLTLERFKARVSEAAQHARQAVGHMRSARIQSVGELEPAEDAGVSYEVATIETDRELVQGAILATLGNKLSVQQALTFTTTDDEELTKEPFFVVDADDHYISDVLGSDAIYDVRRFRGGVAIEVVLDPNEQPLLKAEFERRLREVGLQPEFEGYRTREPEVFPLGAAETREDGDIGYKRFGVLAVDESLPYDDDPVQWRESLARPQLAQIQAALGQEKSLTKVVQFAPQIARQTKNRTMFAIALSLAAIVCYLWLRFGKKEYGLAAIVALVHDVAITLGLVGLSQFVFDTIVGKALLIDAFRIDLPMIAAALTVIGYSLNDTIVVFDRIRENKGRVESLNSRIINQSINQTLSRTVLTSFTTFLVVFILYVFGGKGVHGFSFALLIGIVVGTYSSIGVATPLLYRPKLLHGVVMVLVALAIIGLVFALVDHGVARLVLVGLAAAGCLGALARLQRGPAYVPAGRPVGA